MPPQECSFDREAHMIPVQIEELRGKIKGVESKQTAHEDICAVRYNGIRDDIKTLKQQITAATSIIVAIVVGVLSWSLKTQYDMNEATMKALIAGQQHSQGSATLPRLPGPSTP